MIMGMKSILIAGSFATAVAAGALYASKPYLSEYERAHEAYDGVSILPAYIQIALSEKFTDKKWNGNSAVIQYYAREGDDQALINYVASMDETTRTDFEKRLSEIRSKDSDVYSSSRRQPERDIWDEINNYFIHSSRFDTAMRGLIQDESIDDAGFEIAVSTFLHGYSEYLKSKIVQPSADGSLLGVMVTSTEEDFADWIDMVRDVRGNERVVGLLEDNLEIIRAVRAEVGDNCAKHYPDMCWLDGRFNSDLDYSF